MTKSAVLKQNQGFLSTLPLGVILAWHRDFDQAYIPPLPPGWVECNGQVLDDPESPFDGQTIPNLNGDANGADSPGLSRKEQMFLRGNTTSGEGQDHQMQSHRHQDPQHTHSVTDEGHHHSAPTWSGDGSDNHYEVPGPSSTAYDYKGAAPTTSDSSKISIDDAYVNLGDPTDALHGPETRPTNMSVVWIIKVKQLVSVKATSAVQAETNAPLGALFVNQAGNVGVGTATPQAKLEVNGELKVSGNVQIDGILNATELTGSVSAFAMQQPPDGWLECNGQALSRVDYARLFGRIGATFGSGDGATTFNVPDLRDRFIQGWNHNAENLGSYQEDDLKEHTHSFKGSGAVTSREGAIYVWDHVHSYSPSGGISSSEIHATNTHNFRLMYCIKY